VSAVSGIGGGSGGAVVSAIGGVGGVGGVSAAIWAGRMGGVGGVSHRDVCGVRVVSARRRWWRCVGGGAARYQSAVACAGQCCAGAVSVVGGVCGAGGVSHRRWQCCAVSVIAGVRYARGVSQRAVKQRAESKDERRCQPSAAYGGVGGAVLRGIGAAACGNVGMA
jgi:hypothetical protein